MTNSRNNSKSNFNFWKEIFSSKEFFAAIGERVFGFIVGTASAILLILGIAWLIDLLNEKKAKKEAERKAKEEERKRKEEEENKKKREAEEAADLGELNFIYDLYFNSRIEGKTYKNLHEVEDQFENKVWKEFRQEAHSRKLTDQDFDNFRNKVIEFRKKLERVYNY